ncbi:MAG: TetR/AcrR family transcriptional regulator [Acidimicrobiia bacterium]|nr:TetR/AcrR family transcriptional regulator [Acidimicrobiia bacterium]
MSAVDAGASATVDSSGTRSREDVVAAASRLFAKRGFHGTSMRDLGEELGMLGSSLYSHVSGKNELLVEVVQRGAQFFNEVVASSHLAEAPAVDRLRLLVYGHVGVVIEHIDESRTFLFESRFLPAADRQKIVEMRDEYEAVYRRTIREGIAEGSLSPEIDPGITAIFILSVLNALVRWYRPTGERDADQIAAEMWSFVANGVVVEGADG